MFKKKDDKSKELEALLKAKLPSVFEREPAAAYAEGNLKALIEAILNLF